jgi:putative ABC transport system permease protein
MIIHHYTGNIPLNAFLAYTSAISLVILSIILTLIGGFIPSKHASRKDPVVALRTE